MATEDIFWNGCGDCRSCGLICFAFPTTWLSSHLVSCGSLQLLFECCDLLLQRLGLLCNLCSFTGVLIGQTNQQLARSSLQLVSL